MSWPFTRMPSSVASTSPWKRPKTESYSNWYAMRAWSALWMLIPQTSTLVSRISRLRRMTRPMRPNPLMPTLIFSMCPLRSKLCPAPTLRTRAS